MSQGLHRVVVDTNVLFAGLTQVGGAPSIIVDAWLAEVITCCVSNALALRGSAMGRMTVRLPESLHQQLQQLADLEDVSLNHYIVYALTRQVTQQVQLQQVPTHVLAEERAAYTALLRSLSRGDDAAIKRALEQREPVAPEEGLTPEIIAEARQRIANAKQAR
jgi:uncharacterized protein (DUF1778 family)